MSGFLRLFFVPLTMFWFSFASGCEKDAMPEDICDCLSSLELKSRDGGSLEQVPDDQALCKYEHSPAQGDPTHEGVFLEHITIRVFADAEQANSQWGAEVRLAQPESADISGDPSEQYEVEYVKAYEGALGNVKRVVKRKDFGVIVVRQFFKGKVPARWSQQTQDSLLLIEGACNR